MKKVFVSLAFVALLFGCSNSQDRSFEEEANYSILDDIVAEEAIEPISQAKATQNVSEQNNIVVNTQDNDYVRKIERTIDLTIKTDDVIQEKNALKKLEKHCGGYAESENYNGNSCYLTLRIPTEQVDVFIDSLALGTTGKITEKNESIVDLSATYYDNVSRKKSKDAALDRYRELFKQAKNVSEILQIQAQIDRIQEDADLAASRIKEINNRVAYSTISIAIVPRIEIEEDDEGFFFRIWDGIKTGWNGLVDFFVILINIWPLMIAICVGIYFIIKRKKKKKQAKNAPDNKTSISA